VGNEKTENAAASSRDDGMIRSAAAELRLLGADQPKPGLHLVATPIGHLGDITLRALSVLAAADVIYCEDTRHSRKLMARYDIRAPLKPYHEHNAEAERPRILAELTAGRVVALISDAGTPLVSDPGYKLVRDALDAGHNVESLPGPSAALVALTLAGLPTDAFFFAGFLPAKSTARRTRLKELSAVPATLIIYEAPSRIAEMLADARDVLGARKAAVARELTKMHEDVRRGTLNDLAAAFAGQECRGEFVVLIGPPEDMEASDETIGERLAAVLETMSLRDAAKLVAAELGAPKARVYDLALKLKGQSR
jgi:16S rRNA (cytidine1402-2'-O)-methyltransferase